MMKLRIRSLRLRWSVVGCLFVFAATSGCGPDKTTAPGIPDTPPGIRGRITAISANGAYQGTIRVELDPSSIGGPKAIVTVTGETAIFRVIHTDISLPRGSVDFRGFDVGQWLRVWFDGWVREPYPVQGSAGTVVIDSGSVSQSNRISR